MQRIFLTGLIFILSCFRGYGQAPVVLSAKTDASRITVGDRVGYFIEIQQDQAAGGMLVWAVIPDTFNSLEVIERGRIDTLAANGTVTYRQKILLTGFDSGLFKIPPFAFSWIPPGADTAYLYPDSFFLEVMTVPVDTTQPYRGIKEILLVQTSWKDYLPQILAGIAVLLIAAWLFLWWRRRSRKRSPAAPQPVIPDIPLYDRTMQALADLEKKQLWQQDRIKTYYTELTDILRSYIEERFRTPALELTTDELLETAHRHLQMKKYYDELAAILTTADLAKFAKAKPLPQEHLAAMDHVRTFVTATREVISERPQNIKTT